MLDALEKYHQDLIRGMEEVRMLSEPPKLDLARLALARLRLSQISSARSRLVTEQVIPTLLADADHALREELTDMQKAFAQKRLRSSQHVSAWSTQSIEADPRGYRMASRSILAMMAEQIDRERTVLVERLRHARVSRPAK